MKKKLIYALLYLVAIIPAIIPGIVSLTLLNKSNKDKIYVDNTELYCYIKEAELKYWESKSKLVSEVQGYIDSIAPTSNLRAYELVELCNEYMVDIKFALAQGEVESHFGTEGLAAKTNFVWNVGAEDGKDYNEILNKYKKSHPNESIEPYLKLLRSRYMVNKLEIDLLIEFTDVDGNRYASDQYYEKKLTDKYNYISNHTKIDSLQKLINHYAVKCGRN